MWYHLFVHHQEQLQSRNITKVSFSHNVTIQVQFFSTLILCCSRENILRTHKDFPLSNFSMVISFFFLFLSWWFHFLLTKLTEVSYLSVARAKCPCNDQGPSGEGTNLKRRDYHANANNTRRGRLPKVEMRHYWPSDGLWGRITVVVYGECRRNIPLQVFKISENSAKNRQLKH